MSGYVGQPIPRAEDERLLTGRGEFLADIRLPGTLDAAFVRSPFAHATVLAIDTSTARSLEGVAEVLTAETLPPHTPLIDTIAIEGLTKTPQNPLATDRVRYVGEPVALVVAENRYIAEDAAILVHTDLERLPAVTDAAGAARDEASILFPELGSNIVYSATKTFGKPDQFFSSDIAVHSLVFDSGRMSACPLETRGCIASYDTGHRTLTVWSSTQSQHLLRRRLATTTRIPENRIRVIVPDVGGGFGQKIPAAPEEIAVALASISLRRPVRWIEDRRENLIAAPQAKQQTVTVEMAVAEDGTFLAMRARVVGDSGAYSFNTASALIEPYLSALLMPSVYTIDHFECEIVAVLTNKSPVSPYRGVGWTASHTARELLIDQIAAHLGRDPADLRRQNMVAQDQLPYSSCSGMTYDSGSFIESLNAALDLIGYPEFRDTQERAREQGRLLGLGISPYVEPGGWGSGGAAESGWTFSSHDAARVTMDPSGQVTVSVGTPSQGQGHHTTLAQLAADSLGVDIADVRVINDDTATTPASMAGTRASRVAVVSGGAVLLAAGELRERLDRIGSYLLDAPEDELEFDRGVVRVRGIEGREISIAEIAAAAYFDSAVRVVDREPDLSVQRFYDPAPTYSNGCIVSIVELDRDTGQVEILDLAAVEDCGTAINPMIVDGQIRGAVAQGIGCALLERVVYDDEGQIRTSTFVDYLLPTADVIPMIKIGRLESPSLNSVGGIKGIGESGMIAVPASIANAVADASSPRANVTRLPLDPEYVVSLLEAEETTAKDAL